MAAVAILAACGVEQTAPALPSEQARELPVRTLTGSGYKALFSFDVSDGAYPLGNLIDINGMLYGTTEGGGLMDAGTVYQISSSGEEQLVYAFKGGADGFAPHSSLIDVKGTLYGTTYSGGSGSCVNLGYSGCGTVFAVSKSGAERVLYSFKGGRDGAYPYAGLVAVNGTLYGTTDEGGNEACPYDGCGTVFALSTSGEERVLYRFKGGSDARNPRAQLIAVNGTLYGTTFTGGSYDCPRGCGTVFAVTTSGKESVLYTFKGLRDGANPWAALVAVGGSLYGTTYRGDDRGDCGTVFELTMSGVERVLHRFGNLNDGRYPVSGLVESKGVFYGTTSRGGSACRRPGCGTVFRMNASGSETVLYSFRGTPDGRAPYSLLLVNDMLYGTTAFGGSHCESKGCGMVFRVKP